MEPPEEPEVMWGAHMTIDLLNQYWRFREDNSYYPHLEITT
jgi:hypothetical protein